MFDETERLGRPYYQCRGCAYSTADRAYIEAHVRDHEPRQTLDELLAARAAADAPAKPARSKKE